MLVILRLFAVFRFFGLSDIQSGSTRIVHCCNFVINCRRCQELKERLIKFKQVKFSALMLIGGGGRGVRLVGR